MNQISDTIAAAWRLLHPNSTDSAGGTDVATDTETATGAGTAGPDAGAGAGAEADNTAASGSDGAACGDTGADPDTGAARASGAQRAAAAAADARAQAEAELLEVALACERTIAYLHARQVRALAGLSASMAHGTDPHGLDIDPSAPEIACALAWTPGAADRRVQLSLDLLEMPVVLEALQAGRIDLAKAGDILEGSWGLTDTDRLGVATLAVTFAATHTRGQLRAWLVRALNRVDPDAAARRRKTAQKTRRIRLRPEADGMATLTATLTAQEAVACMEAIRARANNIDGGRDANQADILVELLTGIAAGDQIPIVVMITADTVELPGYGPVPADLAAELLGAGITTPDTPDTTEPDTDPASDEWADSPYQQRLTHDRTPHTTPNPDSTDPSSDNPDPDQDPARDRAPAEDLTADDDAARGQDLAPDGVAPGPDSEPAPQPDTTGHPDHPDRTEHHTPDTVEPPAPPSDHQPPGDHEPPGDPGPTIAARTRPPVADQPPDSPEPGSPRPGGTAARPNLSSNTSPEPAPHTPTGVPAGLRPATTAKPSSRIVKVFNTATPPPAVDRYRPSAQIIRHVRARDRHCRFPGCQQPAINCDIDHTIPYPHGRTDPANLHCLCRRHHRQKTHTGWTVTTLEGDILQWTSPLGRTYLSHPNDP